MEMIEIIKDKHNDWETLSLDKCGVFTKGKGIKKDEAKSEGLPCIRYGEIYTNYHEVTCDTISFIEEEVAKQSKKIKFGDILFAGSGETAEEIGKNVTYIGSKTAYAGGDTIVLTLKNDDPIFMGYLLNSRPVTYQKAQLAQGDAIVHIYPTQLKKLIITKPISKPEQTAIATTLSDIDSLITSLQKLIDKKKMIKQGAMQELLTGKRRLPGFKGEWEMLKLCEIAKIKMGQSPLSSYYNNQYVGLPLIQGNADIENRLTIVRNYTSVVTKKAFKGEIIMTVRAPVGEIAKASFDCCIGRGVCAITFPNNFLFYYLINLEGEWNKYSTGSTFDSINSTQVQELKIKLPKDIYEQTAIASLLSDLDLEIEKHEVKLSKLKSLKQGAMQQLLTGKIRLL